MEGRAGIYSQTGSVQAPGSGLQCGLLPCCSPVRARVQKSGTRKHWFSDSCYCGKKSFISDPEITHKCELACDYHVCLQVLQNSIILQHFTFGTPFQVVALCPEFRQADTPKLQA